MIEFLEKNITSELRNKLIILDNASSHRNEIIKELVGQSAIETSLCIQKYSRILKLPRVKTLCADKCISSSYDKIEVIDIAKTKNRDICLERIRLLIEAKN